MVSRKDVAQKAGVSQATVTNVFNRSKFVSPEIKRKVLEAAAEVGYTDVGTSEYVLLVKDPDNPYNGSILSGMNEAARKYGASTSMVVVDDNMSETVDILLARKVAGVFAAISQNDDIGDSFQRVMAKNGIGWSSSWEDFYIDFQGAMDQLVTYLFGLGHTRIAYLSGIPANQHSNIRYHSLCNAIKKQGGIVYNELLVDGVFPYATDSASGYQAIKKLLDVGAKFTAVVAVNDLMALGAMHALQEAGLSVPDDVSVVGCDNIRVGEFANPPLTTLDVFPKRMGRQIVYTLFQKSNGLETQKIHIVPQLVVRKSTGIAKK